MQTDIRFKAAIHPVLGFAVGYEKNYREIMILIPFVIFEIRLGKRKTKYDL